MKIVDVEDNIEGMEDGEWFRWRGVDVRLRCLKSKRVRSAMDAAGLLRRSSAGNWNDHDEREVDKIIANDVIVEWGKGERGFQTSDGRDVERTPEVALNLVRNPKLQSFRDWAYTTAGSVDAFWRARFTPLEQRAEEHAGN